MAASPDSFAPVEPALLVATFLPTGQPVERNEVWVQLLGAADEAWIRLQDPDRILAAQCVTHAAQGMLVTNQIFPVHSTERDEPLPILLNFIPVHLPGEGHVQTVRAITVTGEVLAEPTSWTTSQTQRHRLEVLGRMTMGIAHDFNNLLSGILGYTQLLKSLEAHPGMHDPEDGASVSGEWSSYETHLDTIERAALDGAALIKRLQQFIRQEKQTRFEHVDLKDVVQECIDLTRPYWHNEPRRQGIIIHLDTDLRDVSPVMGSATELREVIVNLILNAVQAMPEGGTLSLQVRDDDARGVWLTVQDTGIGMSESVQDHIFEPLFTTKGERGTGMGLAVSHGIVQEHEGTIDVTSRPDEGTRFDITFPPAEEVPPSETPEAIQEPTLPARILIIDDEEMVRSVFRKLLTLRGHSVQSAASGAEGLQMARDDAFDIIFVDQAMPEMSGNEFARTFKEEDPETPVILLTGDTDTAPPGDLFVTVLEKPFHIDEIEHTIRSVTQHATG